MKLYLQKLSVLIVLTGIISINSAYSQCPITAPDSVCATANPITLTSTVPGTFSGPGVSGNQFDPAAAGMGTQTVSFQESGGYSLSQTGTYAPIGGTGTGVTLSDDQVSAALPIGFSFNFYGNTYTNFHISSNGFLTFTPAGSGCCQGQVLPNATAPNDVIAFAWDDLYPPGSGFINYFTTGTAPNRILVANFRDVPFCCNSTPVVSTQIQLYEGSGVIQIHTAYANNMFQATMGVEDATGSNAVAVPGRNRQNWTISNDFVEFTPQTGACTSTKDIVVTPGNQINNLAATYCESDDPAIIVGSPAGGILSINGQITDTLRPSVLGSGIYNVSYTTGSYNVIENNSLYAPISGSGTSVVLSDDQVSTALPIGFGFQFFENTYSNFHISSNGFLTFTPAGSGCCSGQLIPNAGGPNDLIAFAWDDMYPPGNGTISYFTTGTSPNRILVVNFTDIPFCCGSTPVVSTQIQLYEGSNRIEIHTAYANNINPGTMGIENSTGTVAFTATNRNSSSWSASNDYVAFEPSGALCAANQLTSINPTPSLEAFGLRNFYLNCAPTDTIETTLNGINSTFISGDLGGPGVTGNIFDPSSASTGVNTIYYTDVAGGCSDTITRDIIVTDAVPFTDLPDVLCDTSSNPLIIPSFPGGTFTGQGVNYISPIQDSICVYSFSGACQFVDGNLCASSYSCINAAGLNSTGTTTNLDGPVDSLIIEIFGTSCSFDTVKFTIDVNGNTVDSVIVGVYECSCTPANYPLRVAIPGSSFNSFINAGGSNDVTIDLEVVTGSYCIPGILAIFKREGIGQFDPAAVTGTSSAISYSITQGSCTISSFDTVYVGSSSVAPLINNSGATTFCQGDSVTLTSNYPLGNLWSTGDTTESITVNSTGNYTLEIAGCSPSANQSVVVNPLPSVTANASSTAICIGDPVTLTGGGAQSYSWDQGVNDGVAFNPTSTATYTVTGTDANGCVNTDQITIVVNPLPTVTASATATAICLGDPVTLTGSGAQSYSWDQGVSDGVAFNPTATATYTVTGTDANGCQNTDQISVTVNPLPTVTANASATVVCIGDPVTLTGGGAQSYSWDQGVSDGVAFNPTSSATYTVTGTDANGCQNTAQISVVVNPLPTVTATTSASAICDGDPVTLTGGGATTYSWDQGVSDGVAFNPTATATYTVTGTDGNGCQNTAQVTVTVDPLPTVVANSTSSAVCTGDTVTLTGSGAQTYSWDQGVVDGVAFVPASTATYTVTGTDINGCQNTDQITVTVNPLPTVTANASATTICDGDIVTLTGGGAQTYTWDQGVTDGVPFSPNITATYTVTGTDVNGCQNTAQVIVNVNSLPVVSAAASSTSICIGELVTLNGVGAQSYSWDLGVTDGVPFSPTATATYTVTGTGANGCTNTAQITVVVNPLPTVTAAASASAICDGDSVTLTGSGAQTYNWDQGVIDGVPFAPTATNTYTVIGIDANGCQDTTQITVTVNPLPSVSGSASATAICVGDQVTLTGAGAQSYSWDQGVTDGVPFNPTATTTYTVTGTDANGCENVAQVTVTVNPLPTVTIDPFNPDTVCLDDLPFNLPIGNPSGGTYSGPGVSGSQFDPAVSGVGTHTIVYDFTDGNGCRNLDSTDVEVVVCVGLSRFGKSEWKLYPNPNDGNFVLQIPDGFNPKRLEVYTAGGVQILEESNIRLIDGSVRIKLGRISAGNYKLMVYGEGQSEILEFIVK